MHLCAWIQRELPQYIADGEPVTPLYTALRAHLERCPACATYAARLRLVEDALRAYPLAPLAADVSGVVRAVIDLESRPQEGAWRLWQPDVGIPAVALLAAVMIAILALPPDLASWGSLSAWAQTPVMGPQMVPSWSDHSVFWAVWIGIFVTTAGLGIGLSLTGWNRQHSRRLSEIESQVSNLASRVWDAHRAR